MDKNALKSLTHGMYVIGSHSTDGRLCGLVADALMQVATSPELIALSLMNTGYTKSQIESLNRFSVSVLGEDINPFVIANFGFQSSKNTDKWSKVDYELKNDLPYLSQAVAFLEASIIGKQVFDSHTLFIAEVKDAWFKKDIKPLTYGEYHTKLKSVVLNMFQKNKEVQKMAEKEVWVCVVCGYIYDGDVPFEELPENWTCPLCGVGKDMFEKRSV
ncbi:MAG: hypothetical protein E7013_05580 [Alphaproteobacteria bacterium]|nr:hypothetical protein [Alphaproteobacteria bacterium]